MFVGKRADGTIYGTWTSPQPNDADHPGIVELPDTHPDVVTFLTRPMSNADPIGSLQTRIQDLESQIRVLNPGLPIIDTALVAG